MKNKICLLPQWIKLAILLLILSTSTSVKPSEPNNTIKDFCLQNVDYKTISTKDFSDVKGLVVVFTCIHCPFAKLYDDRLKEIYTKYKTRSIRVLLINASDTIMFPNETLANMAKIAGDKQYPFPYLFDPSQQVAKNFKADKTPHAFVLWKKQDGWEVRYSGAIDDNGAEPKKATISYVKNALEDLLFGRPVTVTSARSIGCTIHYRN